MASIISPIIGWILTISQYYFALCTLSFVVLTFSKTLRNFNDQFLLTTNETGDQNQVIVGRPITKKKKKNARAASSKSAEIPSPDGTDGSPTKQALPVIWTRMPVKKPEDQRAVNPQPISRKQEYNFPTTRFPTARATMALKTSPTKKMKGIPKRREQISQPTRHQRAIFLAIALSQRHQREAMKTKDLSIILPAAINIQTQVRRWMHRNELPHRRECRSRRRNKSATHIQVIARSWICRRHIRKLKDDQVAATITIQAQVRAWLYHKEYSERRETHHRAELQHDEQTNDEVSISLDQADVHPPELVEEEPNFQDYHFTTLQYLSPDDASLPTEPEPHLGGAIQQTIIHPDSYVQNTPDRTTGSQHTCEAHSTWKRGQNGRLKRIFSRRVELPLEMYSNPPLAGDTITPSRQRDSNEMERNAPPTKSPTHNTPTHYVDESAYNSNNFTNLPMHPAFRRAMAIHSKILRYRTEPAYWRVWADGDILNDHPQDLTRARNSILAGFYPRDVIKWKSSPPFFFFSLLQQSWNVAQF